MFERDPQAKSASRFVGTSSVKAPSNVIPPSFGLHRSFAEAVAGSSRKEEELFIDSTFTGPLKDRMNASLIGKLSSISKLWNIEDLVAADGCHDTKIRYLGGLFVMVDFANGDLASTFLSNSKEVWENWFERLESWTPDFVVHERLAFLFEVCSVF
ncbi:hypothetical protein OROHE_019724 [Orobanche hederae]